MKYAIRDKSGRFTKKRVNKIFTIPAVKADIQEEFNELKSSLADAEERITKIKQRNKYLLALGLTAGLLIGVIIEMIVKL